MDYCKGLMLPVGKPCNIDLKVREVTVTMKYISQNSIGSWCRDERSKACYQSTATNLIEACPLKKDHYSVLTIQRKRANLFFDLLMLLINF